MPALAVRHVLDTAPQVRRDVGAALLKLHLPADLVDDALLVLSELVGNALRHASALPGDTIDVRWELVGAGLTVSVTDGGAPTSPGVRPAEAFRTDGRGLWIVETLAAEWGLLRREGATTVWATLALERAADHVHLAHA